MHKFMLAVMLVVGSYSSSMMAGQRDALKQEARAVASQSDNNRTPQPTCFDRVKSTLLSALSVLKKTKGN